MRTEKQEKEKNVAHYSFNVSLNIIHKKITLLNLGIFLAYDIQENSFLQNIMQPEL